MVSTQEKTPETALVPRASLMVQIRDGVLRPSSLPEAMELASIIAKSGLAPKGYENPAAVFVAIQMGAEVGLSPMAAIQNIAVINGRPSLWGDGLLAIVLGHPDCIDVRESFDDAAQTATCTVLRKGREPVTRTFSKPDSERAGLAGKGGPWAQYPRRMCQMRARAWACRDSFADALRGIKSAEEVTDYQIVEPQPEEPREGVHRFGAAAKRAEAGATKQPTAPTVTATPKQAPKSDPKHEPAPRKNNGRAAVNTELDAKAEEHMDRAAVEAQDQMAGEDPFGEPGARG